MEIISEVAGQAAPLSSTLSSSGGSADCSRLPSVARRPSLSVRVRFTHLRCNHAHTFDRAAPAQLAVPIYFLRFAREVPCSRGDRISSLPPTYFALLAWSRCYLPQTRRRPDAAPSAEA